ncbi:unnamed protein product [Candida verbasci]|uniref:Auxin efflux carrier n=1 Tax=Candida verbasci TaxID=1227364 RepID=A0A9W4TTN1_9ASCO|nr:unnamed protein product [Candida verbasci]
MIKGGDLLSNPADSLSYLGISFLTFEAVLEVIIICFAGFLASKYGLLNIQGQKLLSSLNVDLFTPCLIFSKLALNLSFKKIIDIIIIPIFFILSTIISYSCSRFTGYVLNLNDPETDFVTAMAVFGNSNSLPVSLTLSLAYTLPDLLWDDIEDDSSEKVAGRGILYLLIFQQLGQVLRWSWGFNKLLRKRSHLELNTYYTKNGIIVHEENSRLLDTEQQNQQQQHLQINYVEPEVDQNVTFQEIQSSSCDSSSTSDVEALELKSTPWYNQVPILSQFISFMNPPLWAMLFSVTVASVPFLQNLFFDTSGNGSFIHNTLTTAINNLGSVSIPLILVVLGSNLYPSKDIPPASKHYSRILVGSLLSRMILPSIILLPLIALCVKYINISILDDPIFLIVSFILTISPPAIQLSQISQLNQIYQKEMNGVLFWGYVILTLPTTIFIVVCSLEVLEWAQ